MGSCLRCGIDIGLDIPFGSSLCDRCEEFEEQTKRVEKQAKELKEQRERIEEQTKSIRDLEDEREEISNKDEKHPSTYISDYRPYRPYRPHTPGFVGIFGWLIWGCIFGVIGLIVARKCGLRGDIVGYCFWIGFGIWFTISFAFVVIGVLGTCAGTGGQTSPPTKGERRRQKKALKLQKQQEKEKLRVEKEALFASLLLWKEKERAERLKLAEEKEKSKKAVTHKGQKDVKEGTILVPLLNRNVSKSKFIMAVAGIPAIIAIATTIPILMLNKKGAGTVATASDSGIKPSSTPLPGETERQPSQETLQPPAPETQAGKRGIGPHGSYGVPGVEKPAGESPKTEVPPKTPSTDTKRWITPESTERRLINGRWYKKRYIESPSGSGRFKEVWVPE